MAEVTEPYQYTYQYTLMWSKINQSISQYPILVPFILEPERGYAIFDGEATATATCGAGARRQGRYTSSVLLFWRWMMSRWRTSSDVPSHTGYSTHTWHDAVDGWMDWSRFTGKDGRDPANPSQRAGRPPGVHGYH